jgi:hypothetical protein
MNHDFNESVMILANKDINEYQSLLGLSVEKFLIRYELFISDIETANEQAQKQKAQSIKRKR